MKSLREIHEIMERIYEEEKSMSLAQKAERARQESEKFLKEKNIKLKRVSPKEPECSI